jgi:hypothetical protein
MIYSPKEAAMAEVSNVTVLRLVESGGREATVLEHNSLRVMVDDIGGMVPELSFIEEKRRINAHWLPWFRSNSGKPFRDAEDGAFWKANLLYHLAGSFPCAPSFGAGHSVDGVNMPPHGWTANLAWQFRKSGVDDETGAAWALSTMESPSPVLPLCFRKIDAVIREQNVHYMSLSIENKGNRDLEICSAWHNTVGAPFLAEGCRYSAAADAWITAPFGSEFDPTTRLIPGAEFPSLSAAPLAKGGVVDISRVPGPVGYTDYAAGRIGENLPLGWSSLVNPHLKLAYICFFPGPGAAAEDDIILRFNNLWMQYGGRPFTPWAPYEGGTDLTYCLGTENSIAAYAQGLDYARQVKKVLDTPATFTVSAGSRRTLRYGVLFAPYEKTVLDNGVGSLEGEGTALVCKGKSEFWRYPADPAFTALRKLEKKV